MKEQAVLVQIEHNREITKETDPKFYFEYQRAILLFLKEKGILNEMQCRYGEKKLDNQFHTWGKL